MDRIHGVSSEELMACLIWLCRFHSLVPPRKLEEHTRSYQASTVKITSIEDIVATWQEVDRL